MGLFSRLKKGLKKTSSQVKDAVSSGLGLNKSKLDEKQLEAIEDALLRADVGAQTSSVLIDILRKHTFDENALESDVRRFLADEISKILLPCAIPFDTKPDAPHVVLMVGVNGSGKTTTLGKLAERLTKQGKCVMLAAGDTFRAGAIEQLEIWATRAGVEIISPENAGTDPAGLAFSAYAQAAAKNCEVLFIDTAGRLQNRADLMEELAKIVRVLKKQNETAPQQVLLVVDATVGQNALSQVETFTQIAGVTGLIVTKLDSSAKGGIVVALAQKYKLPIHYVGVGEDIEDLQPFNAAEFADALMDIDEA